MRTQSQPGTRAEGAGVSRSPHVRDGSLPHGDSPSAAGNADDSPKGTHLTSTELASQTADLGRLARETSVSRNETDPFVRQIFIEHLPCARHCFRGCSCNLTELSEIPRSRGSCASAEIETVNAERSKSVSNFGS